MRPVLTADEYRRVDQAYQGDLAEAMDRAGHAVALAAARRGAGYGSRVVVLAGPGNNGGDGYVAARYLRARGVAVVVHRLGEPKTPLAADAYRKCVAAGVPVSDMSAPVDCDLVIDAVFGGGVRGGVPDSVLAWMASPTPVIAIDYPTGLDPDSGKVEEVAFKAVETVTFSTLKTGHVLTDGPDHCGTVTVVDIGISGGEPSMFVAEEADAPRPRRERRSHKWSAGAVLIVGGSTGIVGASVFAGRAALGFGAGAVAVASANYADVHRNSPQVPAFDLADAEKRLDRFDVVVAGPGLAETDVPAALPIVAKARKVVLDAGGLIPEMLDAARDGDAEVVLTPHDAEFKRVAGVGAGTYSTRAFATRRGVTVLRKGNPTMITDGCPQVLVMTGGPELASIGTGDVLAGMVGALWARGLGPLEAAVSAAYWHGVAAADLSTHQTVTADVLADHVARYAW